MDLPYTLEKMRDATHELIRVNKLRSCYIRPVAFRGYGEMGLFPLNTPVEVFIAVWPWGAYLGEEGQKHGIRCKVSSWRRMSDESFIPEAKACGQYLNSILAKVETAKAGYDEAILLDQHGNVSEGWARTCSSCATGTSPRRLRLPASWTGSRPARWCRSRRTSASRSSSATFRGELYQADEVFLTGTAAEIVPVREIDDHVVGPPGELTQAIQTRFFDAIKGKRDEYLEWLDFVECESETGRITAAARP